MEINSTINVRAFLSYFFFLYLLSVQFGIAIDVMTPTQSLTDGKNIVSARERFTLGFFSPSNSSHRYVGIWYTMIPQTILWIANRENPVMDFSGVLMINDKGNLVVVDGKENLLWSTNASIVTGNSSAKLLDSGNLVLREGNPDINIGDVFWESFDHPSHVFLPGMKLRSNRRNSENQLLRSWKSSSDPSIGSFSFGVDAEELPQLITKNWSIRYWRTGPWNGLIFIGVPGMFSFYLNGFNIVRDSEGSVEISYAFSNESFILFFVLDSSGKIQELSWDEQKMELLVDWSAPDNKCDVYGICGPFGSCNPRNSPICSCLRGFVPKFIEEWANGNWSGGCVRKSQLKCERNDTSSIEGKGDWFLNLVRMKLPDFSVWLEAEDAKQCEEKCLENCSCVAYAYDNIMDCMFWSRDLMDIQEFNSGGMDLHIRLADSELDKRREMKVITIPTVIIGIITISVCMYFFWRWLVKCREPGKEKDKKEDHEVLLFDMGESIEAADDSSYADVPRERMKRARSLGLPLFDFGRLVTSTNNFSDANMLGQGGFGPVYKGKLTEGQEIAVKRLSKSSGQGLEEFKNEVVLISKLQHRNLVRLLGYCIEGEEKMLVYEYMPNKSLDAFLFDPTKQALLEWPKRFHIVEGIARGLLYLHRDSRLRIIHRDLKASNILLDGELNPKISDFGLARIFGGNQIQADTKRVVGTYGYMSPEYAMEGRFSEKSDVFSFGVLLLEIVSGKKNTSFYHHELTLNLLSYAWKLWNEEKLLELIDPALGDSFSQAEALRCIHVGLLCVQEFAADRPTMSSVVFMLSCETASLPTPKQPAFTERRSSERGTEIC
ncbi:G-type lectin S-receptor-like serine/threonine-protein kinase B120 isoform X2 [Tasmannia lanceolata]|uniref:G-type lectin S-receptor-like serine/threonine-protein kinase B120 isoform X2 n=1 Tax=Tasmannia lanceolata TaxID=3420 RepID=UPI0040649939